MSNKILIDASHPEETRVVVTKGNRIEEFDFESEHKKQLKGNIYLARVTRVEPSLQAAFVEYGGNRHGFLAFSEIHPDYYQLPTAERQALIEAEEKNNLAENNSEEETLETKEEATPTPKKRGRKRKTAKAVHANDSVSTEVEKVSDDEDQEHSEDGAVDLVGAEDALEEVPERSSSKHHTDWRDFKIQEVIKRRQILLVQVVKEERGNKGAALTTYLSLAGRYSVLMPNTARGGGISRKITNQADRKRLKEIVKDLAVPKGMGIILRTAGASRTKAEVRRDYEYLMRLWENVRSLTMTSMAPALVYEEGSLIKRSIRDLYNKNVDEVLVAGEKGYREAKDFMRMLMPSHAKFVQPYKDLTPIFARRGIEAQLDGMLQPEADLKSGGYLVINQTEALVAIDVNSGRSTKEHSIEETALQTNLEAAEEVARQLRLRDLAGLIVIDFIDMQEKRNIRAIEKKLKDCLKDDRARIQVGRISHFGLMEMSRQRIRASVLESTTQPCPHCFGLGYVRSESSLALHVLRVVEEYLQNNHTHSIIVRTLTSTALYVLNHKRRALNELEERFGLTIDIEADDSIGKEISSIHQTSEVAHLASEVELPELPSVDNDSADRKDQSDKKETKTKKNHKSTKSINEKNIEDTQQIEVKVDKTSHDDNAINEENPKKKRRRGRRGGRRNKENQQQFVVHAAEPVGPIANEVLTENNTKTVDANSDNVLPQAEPVALQKADKPLKKRRTTNRKIRGRTSKNITAIQESEEKSLNQQPQYSNNGIEASKSSGDSVASLKNNNNKVQKSDDVGVVANNDLPETSVVAEQSNTETAKTALIPKTNIQHTGEPKVTSSSSDEDNQNSKKKRGWWGRKSFF